MVPVQPERSTAVQQAALDCDRASASAAVAVTGLDFWIRHTSKNDRGEVIGFEVIFRHPHRGTVEIFCWPYSRATVTIDTETLYPTASFLSMVAKIGAAETALTVNQIRSALVNCHKRSLADLDSSRKLAGPLAIGDGEVELRTAEIKCFVYPRVDESLPIDAGVPDRTQFDIKRR